MMPYIYEHNRKKLDEHVDDLARMIDKPGQLNYVICALLDKLTLHRTKDRSYSLMSRFRAAVLDAAAEFYRRVMAPYEDRKAQENGDVFTNCPASSPYDKSDEETEGEEAEDGMPGVKVKYCTENECSRFYGKHDVRRG